MLPLTSETILNDANGELGIITPVFESIILPLTNHT